MKQRQIAQLLAKRNGELNDNKKSLKELFSRKQELIEKIKDAENEEDVDLAVEELEGLEKELNDKDNEVKDLEEEVDKLEKDLDEYQDPTVEERKKNMNRREINPKTNEERSAVTEYIRTRGESRTGFTSADGDVIIPVDTTYIPKLEKGNNELDLAALITTVPVTTASGTHPILKKTKAVFHTVEELEKNPDLAKPEFNDVDYKIKTYRGAIPISQEAIDDAEADLVGIVEDHIVRIGTNTDNAEISGILKTFEKVELTHVDEIKNLKNVKLDPAYNKVFVLSQSFYQLVDTLKDSTGKYLFQESLISPSGYIFLDIPCYIARDEQMGEKGDATGFLGDLEEAVYKFDRQQLGVKWVDNDIYGEVLRGGKRMDIKKVDNDAGVYFTADSLTTQDETTVAGAMMHTEGTDLLFTEDEVTDLVNEKVNALLEKYEANMIKTEQPKTAKDADAPKTAKDADAPKTTKK